MMTLRPPLSKSDALRALVLADILGVPWGEVLPHSEMLPRDVEVLRAGLESLRHKAASIDCVDGAAPLRFLLAQASVLPGRLFEFKGTQRLAERPHGPLLEALQTIPQVHITQEPGRWPLTVQTSHSLSVSSGPLEFSVTGEESSQFASALLLAMARLATRDVQASLHLSGSMTSEGYFALTRSWLERAGFAVHQEGSRFELKAPNDGGALRLRAFPPIPADWSSLTYLLALSWPSGLKVEGLTFGTGHPDEGFVAHLRSVGLSLIDRVEGRAHRGFEVDAQLCPDSIPTLVALATLLPAPSLFYRVGILRHKESNRLEGVSALLRAAGLRSVVDADALLVHPGAVLRPIHFDAQGDHRLAMSAAVLARLHDVPLKVAGMECVAKSFPGFWLEAAKAGLEVEPWAHSCSNREASTLKGFS